LFQKSGVFVAFALHGRRNWYATGFAALEGVVLVDSGHSRQGFPGDSKRAYDGMKIPIAGSLLFFALAERCRNAVEGEQLLECT
jgi:hypothetical protein